MTGDFFKYNKIATDIANCVFGNTEQKEKVRDMIMGMVAQAYLDKSDKQNQAMSDFVNYYNNKYVK